jgi:hypothetical protein
MGVTPRRVALAALVLASVLLPLRGASRYTPAPQSTIAGRGSVADDASARRPPLTALNSVTQRSV